jgi:MOSC domain-containing protein YiiM
VVASHGQVNRLLAMHIVRIYVSSGHNFFGHHGMPAGEHSVREVDAVECVAGRGIRGDRFFDYKPDYKGQITFFDEAVWIELRDTFPIQNLHPGVLRRNVILRDCDLNAFIGKDFELQGVRFLGTGECSPCYWMDSACHPGTEAFLKNRGGLRAKILTSGTLRTNVSETGQNQNRDLP